MKMFNSLLEKATEFGGRIPSYEKPKGTFTDPATSEYHMSLIFDHVAHCQITLPVVIDKAQGSYLWDVTGKKYIDFLSAYGCANQGHCHPKVLEALTTQAQKLPMNSMVTHHSALGPASKHLTEKFGYDKILFMNSGAEAVDSAILTARRWGYQIKKIPNGEATVLFPKNNYWGMITSSRSGSDDPMLREGAGPLATDAVRFDFVGYDDVEALEAKFKANPNICAFIFEPIQGHAGNIHPKPGYYARVRELCDKYDVLMISDEVQAGLGRTGKLFTCDWESIRPDMITLGKALGADFLPVSALLANDEIMDLWPPGSHVSTYGANSLACAVSVAAVDVLFDEGLIENAEKLGKVLEEEFKKYDYPFIIQKNCGRGLFASLQFKDYLGCLTVCTSMLEKGIMVLPGPGAYLKVMPPLCITEEEFRGALKILKECLDEYDEKGKLGLFTSASS